MTYTFLIAGQSYAGNSNDKRLMIGDRSGRATCYDMQTRSWRIADDPQPQGGGYAISPPGRDAEWGSIWPAFGDLFSGETRLVTCRIKGEPIAAWLESNDAIDDFAHAAAAVENDFRFILWQHGESDTIAGTRSCDYVRAFRELRDRVARKIRHQPIWLVAMSTHHPTVNQDLTREYEMRTALHACGRERDCRPGPDTDLLKGAYRSPKGKSEHYTELGQRAAAAMWFSTVIAQE
jgi:hypothetical protein